MQNSTREFEIKLLFPENKLKPIEQFIISRGGVRRQHLLADYIDTPDFLLLNAGIAFRLRREGREWVQTLKISTLNPLDRIEHNVRLEANGAEIPQWSISYHYEHPAWQEVLKRLPKLPINNLSAQFRIDVWRRKACINTRSGVLEYALDQGFIYSNIQGGPKTELIQELEIELKEGHAIDVLNHAKAMIKRFKARLDTRSKSERGYLLAIGKQVSPANRAGAIKLKKLKTREEVISLLINSCLAQILPNQSALAANFEGYDEHLHQLRVGLRRLKTLLKYLSCQNILLSDEGGAIFTQVFSTLGKYRDNHYVSEVLNPILKAHNGQPVEMEATQNLPHPSIFLRQAEFQLFLLEIMSLDPLLASPSQVFRSNEKFENLIKKTVYKILNKTFQFFSEQVPKIDILEDEALHTLRKKLKFLRYSLEFFKDFCRQDKFTPFFKQLSLTLDNLGNFNDICVSITRIELMAKSDPLLLFAIGWLKAERLRTRGLCESSIKKLSRTSLAW